MNLTKKKKYVVVSRGMGFLKSNHGWVNRLDEAEKYTVESLKHEELLTPTGKSIIPEGEQHEFQIIPLKSIKVVSESTIISYLYDMVIKCNIERLCVLAEEILQLHLAVHEDGVTCTHTDRRYGFREINREIIARLISDGYGDLVSFYHALSPDTIVRTIGNDGAEYYFAPTES